MSSRRTYNQAMIPRPQTAEAAPYYFTYIDRVTGDDPLAALENQLEEGLVLGDLRRKIAAPLRAR